MDFTYLKKPSKRQLKSTPMISIYVNMPDGARVITGKFASEEIGAYYYIIPVFKKTTRA